MFIFQTLHGNSFDFQLKSKKAISFHGGMYSTNDPEIAEELRARQNHDFWEVPPDLVEDPVTHIIEEKVPKRKGRPPKVQVVQGARSSDLLDK
jgi:hypothetical protein